MRPISHLGFEPPMFRGLSGSELTVTLICSVGPGLVLGVLVFAVTGSLLWMFPALIVTAFVCVLCVGTLLLRWKRNHTPHWYLQRAACRFPAYVDLVVHTGRWRSDR